MFLRIEKTVSLKDLKEQLEHDIKTADIMIKSEDLTPINKGYYEGAKAVLQRYLKELER